MGGPVNSHLTPIARSMAADANYLWHPVHDCEDLLLAPYAMHSANSQGRRHRESPHPYRGPFQRDRDRIVHTAAYRRLAYKTQVFTGNWGDYHRSRLTHTIEVASVSRTLSRALRLNEDLTEALALLHDIGHPPFGHAGEDTLDESLRADGGFSHNGHALRIVEKLEKRYPGFFGLNLSIEVLESQDFRVRKSKGGQSPLLEAQAVEAADSVTYDTHDADDALELGLLRLDELLELPLWHEARRRVRSKFTGLTRKELRRSVYRELIDWHVSDLIRVANERLGQFAPSSAGDVRRLPEIISPSDELREKKAELESFLHERVYRHAKVLQMRARAQQYLTEMIHGYVLRPALMPKTFRRRIGTEGLRRTVGDFVAGMTDRYAHKQYRRLFAGD